MPFNKVNLNRLGIKMEKLLSLFSFLKLSVVMERKAKCYGALLLECQGLTCKSPAVAEFQFRVLLD